MVAVNTFTSTLTNADCVPRDPSVKLSRDCLPGTVRRFYSGIGCHEQIGCASHRADLIASWRRPVVLM